MKDARYFRSQGEFRRWLSSNHEKAAEQWVGFYKVSSGRGGITYREALDEALCFGWIDGVRRSIDDERWAIRFVPRRPRSIWSRVNIERVRELAELGRMRPPGLAAFERRDEARMNRYSNEQASVDFGAPERKALRANHRAWEFFSSQAPSYRRAATWWVMSAKKDETRARRVDLLVAHSAAGERVPPLTPPGRRRGRA